MGNGSTAEARLVGEDAPLEAHQNDLCQGAGDCGLACKGIGKDAPEGSRHGTGLGKQNNQASQYVGHSHEGDKGRCHLGDPLHSANNHQEHQSSQHHAGEEVGNTHSAQGAGHLEGLDTIADAERSQHAKQGKEDAQPAPLRSQAVLDVIHGTTHVITEGIHFPVMNRQDGFGVFGGNPEERHNPHPEHGAGATDKDCAGHTGNVPRSHRGGEGRHQRLEGSHVPGIPVFYRGWLQHQTEAVAQPLDRHEPEPQHQEDTCCSDEQDRGPSPGKTVDRVIDRFDQSLNTRRSRHQGQRCHHVSGFNSAQC